MLMTIIIRSSIVALLLTLSVSVVEYKLNIMNSYKEIEVLRKLVKEQSEQLRLHSVSNSVATDYAEFCVRCDRDKLPLLCLEDYINQYCC